MRIVVTGHTDYHAVIQLKLHQNKHAPYFVMHCLSLWRCVSIYSYIRTAINNKSYNYSVFLLMRVFSPLQLRRINRVGWGEGGQATSCSCSGHSIDPSNVTVGLHISSHRIHVDSSLPYPLPSHNPLPP